MLHFIKFEVFPIFLKQYSELCIAIVTSHLGHYKNGLDRWNDYHNNKKTHQNKICNGKIPMKIFQA